MGLIPSPAWRGAGVRRVGAKRGLRLLADHGCVAPHGRRGPGSSALVLRTDCRHERYRWWIELARTVPASLFALC